MKKAAIFMPLAAGACWGASGIFVRTLRAADFNNITIMFSRAIVGFVLLFVFLMIHDRSLLRIRLCDLPVFLSAAINGYLLMNTCYNLTVESLTLSGFCAAWSVSDFRTSFRCRIFSGKNHPVKSQLHADRPLWLHVNQRCF